MRRNCTTTRGKAEKSHVSQAKNYPRTVWRTIVIRWPLVAGSSLYGGSLTTEDQGPATVLVLHHNCTFKSYGTRRTSSTLIYCDKPFAYKQEIERVGRIEVL